MAKTRQTVLSQSRPQLISPTCAVCAQLVTAHFDNRGRFVGCTPTVLTHEGQAFVLVPDTETLQTRLIPDRRAHASDPDLAQTAARRQELNRLFMEKMSGPTYDPNRES